VFGGAQEGLMTRDAAYTRYTNAPEAYDYETTVLASTPVPWVFAEKLGPLRPPSFRQVTLIGTDGGYYVDYQMARYQSGGYLVATPEQWASWIADGIIVEASSAAEGREAG
jgi:hypothetical protein